MENVVNVYTDGGCVPNPGVGAWAALLIKRDKAKYLSGFVEETTNNQMELTAAIEGLRAFRQRAHVLIHTDSEYVQKGIHEWMPDWQRRKWKRVKNKELWLQLDLEIKHHHSVRLAWVQSHTAGNAYNNFVDWLVEDAINRRTGRMEVTTVGELQAYIQNLKLRIWR